MDKALIVFIMGFVVPLASIYILNTFAPEVGEKIGEIEAAVEKVIDRVLKKLGLDILGDDYDETGDY